MPGVSWAARICLNFEGDNDILTVDFEYPDMAAYAASVDEMVTSEYQASLAQWYELTTAVDSELMLAVA